MEDRSPLPATPFSAGLMETLRLEPRRGEDLFSGVVPCRQSAVQAFYRDVDLAFGQ